MEGPREVAFYESANRPHLLMGGDRVLMILSFLVSAIVVFSGLQWWSVISGVGVLGVLLGVVSRMGKADPMLRDVYVAQLQYKQSFYPAKSGFRSQPLVTPKKWRGFRLS
jgi:type IV secretion system protein VirB3